MERGAASGSPQVMMTNHLIKAIVMHALNRDAEASVHLSKGLCICRSLKLCQLEFTGLLIGAKINFDGGHEDSGREFLRKAMAAGSTDTGNRGTGDSAHREGHHPVPGAVSQSRTGTDLVALSPRAIASKIHPRY